MKTKEQIRAKLIKLIESDSHNHSEFFRDSFCSPSPAYQMLETIFGKRTFSDTHHVQCSFMHHPDKVKYVKYSQVHEVSINSFYPVLIKEQFGDYVVNDIRVGDFLDVAFELRKNYKLVMRSYPGNKRVEDYMLYQGKVKVLINLFYSFALNREEFAGMSSYVTRQSFECLRSLIKDMLKEDMQVLYADIDTIFVKGDLQKVYDVVQQHAFERGFNIETHYGFALFRKKQYVTGKFNGRGLRKEPTKIKDVRNGVGIEESIKEYMLRDWSKAFTEHYIRLENIGA